MTKTIHNPLNQMEKAMTNNSIITTSNVGQPTNRHTKNAVESLLRVLKELGMEEITRKQWLAIRKAAGKQIDPETAEVMWVYRDALLYVWRASGIPRREYYVRSPGSIEWILVHDLPKEIQVALMIKHDLVDADI